MSGEPVFRAVIADMDGVLTRTADVHERAWREVFDEFLATREGQRPFSSADYREHVDGKPRYDCVADFLASRGIELPRGNAGDDPDRATVCGLGNRKNRLFLELLGRDGVRVFEDAAAALARWRRGGLRLGVVSASRNCRRVLQAAGLEGQVDIVVDGKVADALGLGGKQQMLIEAAARLSVDPEQAVVLEDATSGVRAGQVAGFGCVYGVARGGGGRRAELLEAGADHVVHDVFRAGFPRRLPHALDRLEELAEWRDSRPLGLFLDYDGTLTPIVDDPGDAWLDDAMRSVLRRLAASCRVAIVSGRDREDVTARVGIEEIVYAGNHGFDIAGPGCRKTLPEAEAARGEVERAREELEAALARYEGAIVERKAFSVAAHFRKVRSDAAVAEIREAVAAIAHRTGLRMRTGKQVLELEPAIDWHKGRALEWLLEVFPEPEGRQPFLAYIGDDDTDEDAFAALQGRGPGIRVGGAVTESLADYRLAGPGEVRELLALWLESCERPDR